MDAYIPLISPDGRTIFMPQNLLAYGVYADTMPVMAAPVMAVVNNTPLQNPVAPVSLPEFVETLEAPLMQEQFSEEEVASESPEEVFQEAVQEPETPEVIQDTMEEITVEDFVGELIEEFVENAVEEKVEAPEPMQVPEMKKVKTIEQDDIVDDTMSVTSDASSFVSVASGVSEDSTASVNIHDQADFPKMHDDDESGEVPRNQDPMIKKNLPVYVTKVAMRVRSDCTRNAPEIHRLEADTRVFAIENGIESFGKERLVRWWLNTFTDMDSVADNIRRYNIDGRALADFSGVTVQQLGLYEDEIKAVKKQLALVSRKTQIVYYVDGEAQRGWVSKIKGGKAQMSRIFLDSKPSIVIRRMDNDGLTIARCEERLAHTFEALDLECEAFRLGTYFEEFRFGPEFIINKKGRKRHGAWRPASHCLVEFSTHKDAATALKKLASFSAYPDTFDVTEGFALYSRNVKIAFEREYANLEEISYPRF